MSSRNYVNSPVLSDHLLTFGTRTAVELKFLWNTKATLSADKMQMSAIDTLDLRPSKASILKANTIIIYVFT
jgi:hypothetical protein